MRKYDPPRRSSPRFTFVRALNFGLLILLTSRKIRSAEIPTTATTVRIR